MLQGKHNLNRLEPKFLKGILFVTGISSAILLIKRKYFSCVSFPWQQRNTVKSNKLSIHNDKIILIYEHALGLLLSSSILLAKLLLSSIACRSTSNYHDTNYFSTSKYPLHRINKFLERTKYY